MTEHTHTCTTCNRPAGCPGCGQAWPRGEAGYLDGGGYWRRGERPTKATPVTPATPGEKALDAAVVAEGKARAKWEAAELARRAAEHKARSGPALFSNGMPFNPNKPEVDRKLRELANAVEEAREEFRRASNAVLAARQQLRPTA